LARNDNEGKNAKRREKVALNSTVCKLGGKSTHGTKQTIKNVIISHDEKAGKLTGGGPTTSEGVGKQGISACMVE